MGDDRVYLCTGCASGIGRKVADRLVARGARLLATDIDEQGLARAGEAGEWPADRVRRTRLDVRRSADWEAAVGEVVDRWGRLDVLLNVAGYLLPGWVEEVDEGAVDRHFDINVKGLVHGTRVAARQMVAQGSGHIVNVASLAGIAPIPGISLYSASKFAVRGFSLAAAQELAPKGVKVTVVCPDAVATPMLDLQVGYDQAAMTFSGPRPLDAGEVADVLVGRALDRGEMEITLPMGRGLLARLGGFAPDLSKGLGPKLVDKGRKAQDRLRGG